MGSAIATAAAQLGHAVNIICAESLQPPSPPNAPSQLDAITYPTPRLHGTKIFRHWFNIGANRRGFGIFYGIVFAYVTCFSTYANVVFFHN
jgi:hypothetical protein